MTEPLFFIPGMMCDARLFSSQLTFFSARHTVIVAALVKHATIGELASDLLDNAPQNFALAGLSMGGIVAMEMMRQQPKRITRLALMDTNPLADPPERVALRDRQIADIGAGKLTEIIRDEMKPLYLADAQNQPAILDLCLAMAHDLGADNFILQMRALQSRQDQRETLKTVRVPSLVLCGEADRLCPPERHRMMHDIMPTSHLEIIAGAGHLPTLEQPTQTNQALEKWLQM